MQTDSTVSDPFGVEVWKPVPSMPELEASSHGRVRRLPHVKKMPHGGDRTYSSKPVFGYVTRAAKLARHVYFGVYYSGIGNVKVHRAVCEAFHGAPSQGQVVLHLNENSLDNRPENLAWGSQKQNLNAPRLKKYHRARKQRGASKVMHHEIYYGMGHFMNGL